MSKPWAHLEKRDPLPPLKIVPGVWECDARTSFPVRVTLHDIGLNYAQLRFTHNSDELDPNGTVFRPEELRQVARFFEQLATQCEGK